MPASLAWCIVNAKKLLGGSDVPHLDLVVEAELEDETGG